jgi:hypothetical protein
MIPNGQKRDRKGLFEEMRRLIAEARMDTLLQPAAHAVLDPCTRCTACPCIVSVPG